MPLFGRKKASGDDKFLREGQDIVDCVDLLYRLLDQLYDVANKTTELILLVQDRELKRVKLPEEPGHSLDKLRKLMDMLTSRCS